MNYLSSLTVNRAVHVIKKLELSDDTVPERTMDRSRFSIVHYYKLGRLLQRTVTQVGGDGRHATGNGAQRAQHQYARFDWVVFCGIAQGVLLRENFSYNSAYESVIRSMLY